MAGHASHKKRENVRKKIGLDYFGFEGKKVTFLRSKYLVWNKFGEEKYIISRFNKFSKMSKPCCTSSIKVTGQADTV